MLLGGRNLTYEFTPTDAKYSLRRLEMREESLTSLLLLFGSFIAVIVFSFF